MLLLFTVIFISHFKQTFKTHVFGLNLIKTQLNFETKIQFTFNILNKP